MLESTTSPFVTSGIYYVNGVSFLNRSDALIYASTLGVNAKIVWDYHDDVFSKVDWKKPVNYSLEEMYKMRAQQIRDTYDHVVLNFSGGVDSTNALLSFIDNGIHLDEVIMYAPTQTTFYNNFDARLNPYNEIYLAAIPFLKKFLNNSKTRVRVIDMQEMSNRFFSSNIVSQFYKINAISPNVTARLGAIITDEYWNTLYSAGKKVAHVTGQDKPIINYQNQKYTFSFNNEMIPPYYELSSSTEEAEKIKKHVFFEYFYHSPTFPLLLVKQCQFVKNICENDDSFKRLYTDSHLSLLSKFLSLNHQIYSPKVNYVRDLFHVGYRPASGVDQPQHWWINDKNCVNIRDKFNELITYARDNIDSRFFVGAPTNIDSNSLNDAYYNLNKRPSATKKTLYKFIRSRSYDL